MLNMCLIVKPWLCPMIKYCTHYCKLFQAATQCSNPRTFAQSRGVYLHMRRLPIKKILVRRADDNEDQSSNDHLELANRTVRESTHERDVYLYMLCVCAPVLSSFI